MKVYLDYQGQEVVWNDDLVDHVPLEMILINMMGELC